MVSRAFCVLVIDFPEIGLVFYRMGKFSESVGENNE